MSMFYYRRRMAEKEAASKETASQAHIATYTKNQRSRLKAAEAKELAVKLGIDFAEDAPGTQVKALVIEKLGL